MISVSFFTFFRQADAVPRQGGSFITALIPFILIFLIFYVLIIMPSRKRQKKHQDMVAQLKPGDKIVTSGGIYGSVMGVQKDRIELKIASNVKIDITKNSVAAILTQKTEEQKKPVSH
ncbi:preprotein translocase subunit YajC [Acidobacteriota bacterium]